MTPMLQTPVGIICMYRGTNVGDITISDASEERGACLSHGSNVIFPWTPQSKGSFDMGTIKYFRTATSTTAFEGISPLKCYLMFETI